VFRFRIGHNTDPELTFKVNSDPDPAFEVNTDPGPDPGFVMNDILRINSLPNFCNKLKFKLPL
jgi:hypothetical protein